MNRCDAATGQVLLLLALALLAAPLEPRADGLARAEAAYRRGDYELALELWRPLARAGDARAQFGLATAYFNGNGVRVDQASATRWYRAAAEQGHGPAQFNLGNAYKHGRGVAVDDAQAAAWWRRAAEQDYAAAQYNLALQYHLGRGVPQDTQQSLQWLRRAADNGHAKAQTIIASLDGTARDAASAAHMDGEAWVLAQDPGGYTIQLMATAHATRIEPALARHGYRGRVAAFRFRRDGRDLYAVIHGAFPERSAARAAIEDLPSGLRAGGAWVRRMADVQELIRLSARP